MQTRTTEARLRYGPGSPGIPIVDLSGDVDAAAQDILHATYAEASRHRPSAILLNFEGVGFINSTGIALIAGLLAQARDAGIRMLACGLTDHYIEIFRITRLADFLSIFPDEASALAAAGTSA